MSKADRRERLRRQAAEAKDPTPKVDRYRRPFAIPVLEPSKILTPLAAGNKRPPPVKKFAVIQTSNDLQKLLRDLETGALATPPGPVFALQLLEIILQTTGQVMTEEEAKQERKVH